MQSAASLSLNLKSRFCLLNKLLNELISARDFEVYFERSKFWSVSATEPQELKLSSSVSEMLMDSSPLT